MRKAILVVMVICLAMYASGQELKSKSGHTVLPESGDWSISFDALPAINYFGNLFNNSVGNTAAANFTSQYPMTIVGKWIKDDGMVWRGKLRLGLGSTSQDSIFNDPHSTANPPAEATNSYKTSHTNITLGFGMQKYKGKGRVQGYYGAEAWLGLGGASTTNTMGATADSITLPFGKSFQLSTSNGTTISFGLRGFIGIEYFFAPKMSIGAEYGWGLGVSSTGAGSSKIESWDYVHHNLKTVTNDTGGHSSFGLDTDNSGGSINLSFYF